MAPPPHGDAAPRLPAPARVVIFGVVAVALTWLIFVALGAAGILTPADASRHGARALAIGAYAELTGVLVATWVMLRWVENRTWGFVALDCDALRPRAIGAGLALGALAIGGPSLALLAGGLLQRLPGDATTWPAALAYLAAVLAPAALAEELALRGYPFAVLRSRWGTTVAVLVTSTLFGVLHIANAHVAVEPIALVILAGVFLAAVLVVTGSLYAAWAAHFAWNFTLAGVVHAVVSGESFPMPGYRLADNGPAWLTGGGWGPEGGASAAAGMLFGGLLLYWPRLRARSRPPADRARATLERG